MTFWEIVLRLGAATLIGGAIGFNRDLHGKPTGVRTLGVVALASAMIVIAMSDLGGSDSAPASRAVQGVLTGIGFLGAGVIMHAANDLKNVRGLTTAACTWLTACVGIICGTGHWRLLAVGVVLVFLLLVLGGPVEHRLHLLFSPDAEAAPPADGAK